MATIQQRGNRWRAQICVNYVRQSKSFKTRALAEAWAAQAERRTDSLPSLRKALEDHRIAAAIPVRMREALSAANYSGSEIAASEFQMPEGPCIYFLIRDAEVRYVGKTIDLPYRLYRHRKAGKKFTGYAVIPCLEKDMAELECTYINLLMPPDNRKLED
jgi:hypothetical protein